MSHLVAPFVLPSTSKWMETYSFLFLKAFLPYPWLSGCPKAKLLNRGTSPVSQRNESLWGLYVNPAEQEDCIYSCQPAPGGVCSLLQVLLQLSQTKIFLFHLFTWTRWELTNPEVACFKVGVELVVCLQLAEMKGQYVLDLLVVDVCQGTTSFLHSKTFILIARNSWEIYFPITVKQLTWFSPGSDSSLHSKCRPLKILCSSHHQSVHHSCRGGSELSLMGHSQILYFWFEGK